MRPLLLVDADDTLWENARFFREARQTFLDILAEESEDHRDEILSTLRLIENEGFQRGEFGSQRLRRSMAETARRHLPELTDDHLATFERLTDEIRLHPIHPYPGVTERLPELSETHRLWLVTMGDDAEQSGKVERSGLAGYFERIEIVADKTVATYEALVKEISSRERSSVFMIGNSLPKDVNPAKAAGLSAVFIDNGAVKPGYFTQGEDLSDLRFPSFAAAAQHFVSEAARRES